MYNCLVCGKNNAHESLVLEGAFCFECWLQLEEFRNLSDQEVTDFLAKTLAG